MTKNNLINKIPLPVWIQVVGVLLVVFYSFLIAMWYWTIGYITLEFYLFVASLICVAGVIYRKEKARKALIVVSGIGVFYVLADLVFISKNPDSLSVLFGLLFISTMFFYNQPFVKAVFGKPLVFHHWNILLIDDDKVLLKMLSSNFAQRGIRLLTAETGEKGLDIALKKKIDLIILDVILPKMKGREVCQRLKEDSRTKDTPIIFLTVKDSADDIRAEFEAGAVSHLTKPVDFDHLYREIIKILGE